MAATDPPATRFMRWYDNSGEQFQYEQLLAGRQPNWKHFYTSNLSLKTELLRLHRFDETFTAAVMEDIELGYRIHERNGLRLMFLPEAVAHHLHPMNFNQACRRFFKAGFSAFRFCELWPELESPPPARWRRMAHRTLWRNSWLLATATFLMAEITKFHCPDRLIRFMLGMHYRMGYLSASRQRNRS
jgi:cellulose synthase/poly-beta-1,6-N-acetylglucosamine synthase-like glycosyltransferase